MRLYGVLLLLTPLLMMAQTTTVLHMRICEIFCCCKYQWNYK